MWSYLYTQTFRCRERYTCDLKYSEIFLRIQKRFKIAIIITLCSIVWNTITIHFGNDHNVTVIGTVPIHKCLITVIKLY